MAETFTFTIRATDSTPGTPQTADRTFTLTVDIASYLALGSNSSSYFKLLRSPDFSEVATDAIAGAITKARFSPDGTMLGLVYTEGVDTIRTAILDTSDFSVIVGAPTLTGSDLTRASLAFSPDSTRLAVYYDETSFAVGPGTLKTYNTSTWATVTTRSDLGFYNYDVEYSLDGSYIGLGDSLTGSNEFILVDPTTLTNIRGVTLPLTSSQVRSITFSPDSTKVAIVATNTTGRRIYIYNTVDLTLVTSLGVSGETKIKYSPTGTYLAYTSSGLSGTGVFNTSDWSVVSTSPTVLSPGYDLDWSADESKLVVSTAASPYYRVYRVSDWANITPATPVLPGVSNACAFSPEL